MYEGKNRRKHIRQKISLINPIQLISSDGEVFFIVPVDESESGLGCIFSGKYPPRAGLVCKLGDEGDFRAVEIRWVTPVGKTRFRLGLMYLD